MAEYNFKIGADTTSAVQSLEALKKTMVDMSNATKSVATLAKAAAKETRNGIDIFSESANATRDLVTVLDMNKKTYQATMSPLKAWEKATKEAATAQQILSKAGADGATTLTAVNYRFRENAKETAKAKKELAEYVKKQKEASMASGVSKKGGGVWQSVFGKDLYHTFIGALSFHAIGMARDAIHAIGQTIAESMELASRAREANNLYSQSFDQIGLAAEDAAKRVESSFSLAESTAKTSIGTFAQYMIGLGKSQAEALKFGEEATKVFLDIRSFKNIEGDLSDFMQKAMSGLAGNTENFRTMGLAINATAAKERLMAKGLGDLEGNAKRAAIAQEYLNMVIEQSQDAIGDFQRNFNSTQNTNQRLSEQWKSWKENFGQGLNKAFDPVKQWFAGMLENVNSMHDILDDLAEEMNAIKNENTTGNGTRYSDFRLRRMWDTAQSAASLNAIIAMQQARGRTLTDAEQTEAGVKGAHDALKAMATELKIPAEKLASVVDMGNRVTSALGKSVTEFGKSIDDEIAKEKQVQEDIANAQNLLAASKTSVTTAQDALSEVSRLIPSSWMSMLTPYQRATGDYDKSSIMSDWLKELQSQYNALASANAELRQSMAGLDKNTAAAQNYADAIAKNEEAMRLLAGFASDATKSIDALRQASDDAKTALEAQAKAQAAQNDMSEFVNGLRTSFSAEKFRTMLGDDPLAEAKIERAESLAALTGFYRSAKEAGVAQDELDSLFKLATGYINDTFDLAKQGIKDIAKLAEQDELKSATEALDDFTGSAESNYRATSRKLGLKGDPLATEKLALQEARTNAADLTFKAISKGMSENDAFAKEGKAIKAINGNFRSLVLDKLPDLSYSELSKIALDKSLDDGIREEAKQLRRTRTLQYAGSAAYGMIDSASGGLVSAGAQGAAAGGPWGAIIAVLVNILEKTEAFEEIGKVMDGVMDAVNDFLAPAIPLIDSINDFTVRIFREILEPLQEPLKLLFHVINNINRVISLVHDAFAWLNHNLMALLHNAAADIINVLPWKHVKRWNYLTWDDLKDSWAETNRIADETDAKIDRIEKAVSETDSDYIQALIDMMDRGLLTFDEFNAMQRSRSGVDYKPGRRYANGNNLASYAQTVTYDNRSQTITINGSTLSVDDLRKLMERILANDKAYRYAV